MTNKYDTLVKYAPPSADESSTEAISEAHFEVLNEVFDWWQLMPHVVPQENRIHGYQITVSSKPESNLHGRCTKTIWGISLVACINQALEWRGKF